MVNAVTTPRLASRGLLAAVVFLGALVGSSEAYAATYQVGPGKPYASRKAVASLLAPGDVVEVMGGTTYAGDVKLTKQGTSAKKITIKGVRVNGKRPVLAGGTNTIELAGNHYVFEGFEITKGSSRCVFHHAHSIVIRDTAIHDCPSHGLLGADSGAGSLTLEYVEVYNAGMGDKRHPIYMATDESMYPGAVFRMQHCFVHDGWGGHAVKSRAERNEIYYNWIEGAFYRELELISPDGQDESLAREDADVVGNVFRKTGTFYTARIGSDATGGSTNGRYRFVNNTFILSASAKPVIEVFWGIESLEMHNNAFYRVGGGGVTILQMTDVDWATGTEIMAGKSNWAPTGSKVPSKWKGTIFGADPKFSSLSTFDLRPAQGSPLRDVGTAAPPSPSGCAFPSPLVTPLYAPPAQKIVANKTLLARLAAGSIDIGAYEGAGLTLQGEADAPTEAPIAENQAEDEEELALPEDAEDAAAGLSCSHEPWRDVEGGAAVAGVFGVLALLSRRRRGNAGQGTFGADK
jgi:hypothetical protein